MEVDRRPNIGGMEKAFSKNIMMRLVEFFAGRLIVDMFGEAPPTTKQRRKRKKTCRRLDNRDWGVWDFLPNELLVSVLMKLSVIDYISFSGVCRSWRSTSIDIHKLFMERQQPLVVVRPRYSKKSCVLYNMFDGKSWKTMLPDLPCKKNHNFILLSESGASIWKEYVLPNTSSGISDVKVLDGKIFVLTCDALFGEFNPRATPVLKLYKMNIPFEIYVHTCLDLVISDSKLYMTISQYLPNLMTLIQSLSFCEIDYMMESVKPIRDLDSKSLFLSRFNSAVVDTSGRGGGNCVCVLQSMYLNKCSFFHLNGTELATVPAIWDGYLKPYFWYFPAESWDISCVGDEFGL
ncbi:hypothetical protein POM88_050440 [Heracleum sosnowskyi]|uniref:F-box domain-containing protein n=1 Tax=Heracleum sosnowskyi TaxID=360622 RepID=A0AAD8M2D4_9APIA|nr:hypothetical protein POM88_050440 [Heracleum sosnowskyi]